MQAFDRGLLVLEAGDDCVRMSPPLVVSQAEAATAVRLFTEAVDHVAANRSADVDAVTAGARERARDRGLRRLRLTAGPLIPRG